MYLSLTSEHDAWLLKSNSGEISSYEINIIHLFLTATNQDAVNTATRNLICTVSFHMASILGLWSLHSIIYGVAQHVSQRALRLTKV